MCTCYLGNVCYFHKHVAKGRFSQYEYERDGFREGEYSIYLCDYDETATPYPLSPFLNSVVHDYTLGFGQMSEVTTSVCTCSSLDLFKGGCTCGALRSA